MRVVICGSRGSTPAPGPEYLRYGGHTSSVAIGVGGGRPNLLLDAGTGARRVTELLDGDPFRGSILLGHLHWDHTHGLPFIRAADRPDARVNVYSPAQGGSSGSTLQEIMAPPHFPITPDELHGQWRFQTIEEGAHEIEGYQVMAREIPHKGGRTFGYRISDGTSVVAYLSDHHPSSYGPGPEGYGPYHDAALQLSAGADLLIHDSQYRDEEWPARAHFGHCTPDYAVGLAKASGARHLLLFHHDPTRTDEQLDELSDHWASEPGLDVAVAMEGQTIDVRDRP